ncbi:MAG: hypothetical protein AAGF11_37140 [Myxococcota bacterium]
MRRMASITWALGLLAFGCSDSAGSSSESGSNNDTGTTGGTFDPSSMTPTSNGDATESVDESGPPPGPGGECILEANDCSDPAEKCMPWSENADRIPDRARCCPLQDNPDLDGEACTVTDYDGSCLDSCDENSMCLVDQADTLEGLCRSFCDPAIPNCNGGEGTCKSFFELVPGSLTVPLCVDKCDPLLQDCSPSSWFCIPDNPTASGQSDFICVPPPPEEPLGPFDACGLANDCQKGLVCVSGDRIPGCDALACCTAYCSLSEGDGPCQEIDGDFVCVDWMAPDPGLSDVGVCALPS